MQGHFADLKQAYVFGIYKALQKYDISTGVPFLICKEHYVKNEIDKWNTVAYKSPAPCDKVIPYRAWTNTERSERQWCCMQSMSINLTMKR